MDPMTEAEAHALLEATCGVRERVRLARCRVNFFETGLAGLVPGGFVLVRQDMLGRTRAHRFERAEVREVEVMPARRGGGSVRFYARGARWLVDRLDADTFEALADLLAGGAELVAQPRTPAASTPPSGNPSETGQAAAGPAGDPDRPVRPPAAPSGLVRADASPAATAASPVAAAAPSPPGLPATAATTGEPAAVPRSPAAATAAAGLSPEGGDSPAAAPPAPGGSEERTPVSASPSPPNAPGVAHGRETPVDTFLDALEEMAERAPSAEDLAPALRRIFHLAQRLEQADRALLAAQGLMALGQAGPLERQLVEANRTNRLLAPVHPLTDAQREALRPLHPSDAALMAVGRACVPALLRMTARPPGDYGLRGAPEGADKLAFGRVFAAVRASLGMLGVSYHPAPEGPPGMRFANLRHEGKSYATLVVGADLLSGRTDLELAFFVAQELTFLHPDHLLRVLVPEPAQQAVILLTAVAMAEPDRPLPEGQEQAIRTQLSALSRYMELDDFERLSRAVKRLLAQPEPFDLLRWHRAVERAALRVGLLLCGDLQVALRCVARMGLAPAAHRIARAELIRFALGEVHLAMRRDLGLAVG